MQNRMGCSEYAARSTFWLLFKSEISILDAQVFTESKNVIRYSKSASILSRLTKSNGFCSFQVLKIHPWCCIPNLDLPKRSLFWILFKMLFDEQMKGNFEVSISSWVRDYSTRSKFSNYVLSDSPWKKLSFYDEIWILEVWFEAGKSRWYLESWANKIFRYFVRCPPPPSFFKLSQSHSVQVVFWLFLWQCFDSFSWCLFLLYVAFPRCAWRCLWILKRKNG